MEFGFAKRFAAAGVLAAAVAGAWAQDVVIGQTGSVTNPLVASLTREYSAGIQLALERANAAGGVKGRKLKLAFRDDGFDAAKTTALVDEMVESDRIVALVGVMGTQPVMRLADDKVLEKHQLASFGPLTGLQSALSRPNVFPVRGSYEDEVRAMLAHSARLGRGKVLYLYYEAGVGPQLAKLVPAMAKDAGVVLTGIVGFPVTPQKSEQQAAVRKALDTPAPPPESVILLAIGPVHSEAVKAVRARYGLGMPVYSLGQVNPAALIGDVGAETARGVMLSQVMPMPGNAGMQVTRDFEADRRKFAAAAPASYIVLEGYICGRIVVEMLRRAKTLTAPAVLQAAEQAGVVDVGGFRVDYGQQGRRSVNPIELTMLSRSGTLIR
ncbi:MAG: ABC transporter substrate-binding protein [Pseudomonadota bacterium]